MKDQPFQQNILLVKDTLVSFQCVSCSRHQSEQSLEQNFSLKDFKVVQAKAVLWTLTVFFFTVSQHFLKWSTPCFSTVLERGAFFVHLLRALVENLQTFLERCWCFWLLLFVIFIYFSIHPDNL